ncbi:MAG: penicillin acylase family protein [Clostridiales bacterium]|nr:penicillin acylase family protein [Clostridiales bacterium]
MSESPQELALTPPSSFFSTVSRDVGKEEGGRRLLGARKEFFPPHRIPSSMKTFAFWLASALLLGLLALPLGPLPPLGSTFNPGTGVAAAYADLPRGQLRLPGLKEPVEVDWDAYGIPHIFAQNDWDLYLVEGYLVARDRLVQMDLMRRMAGGRLAEILGPLAVESDAIQGALGLRRVAEATAARMKATDPETYQLVEAYTQGVNAWIQEAKRTHKLAPFFRLLKYEPYEWSTVDSFLIQLLMTQRLAFTTVPLIYDGLSRALGPERVDTLATPVPVTARLPFMRQQPYHTGPFPPEPIPDVKTYEDRRLDLLEAPQAYPRTRLGPGAPSAAAVQVGLAWVAQVWDALAFGEGASDNWAVAPQRSASGNSLMAGDPHLDLTLPAIWYEVQLRSPKVDAYGVSIPGTPGIIIGRTPYVAWSLTNTQNQQVFYYREKVDETGGRYWHDGQLKEFHNVRVTIPVRGQEDVVLQIRWSVHGPVISDLGPNFRHRFPYPEGETISLAYTGNLYSLDVKALYLLMQAKTAADVKEALQWWGAPTQNFAYATAQGDIGVISAGYYPVVDPREGAPWRILDGEGPSDWIGLIPYAYIPQTENPPWGFVWSANQRNMPPDYPYYVGVSGLDWDFGNRSQTIFEFLNRDRPLTFDDMARLQLSLHNPLAARHKAFLVSVVRQAPDASAAQREAADILEAWDSEMRVGEPGPAIWQKFWDAYVLEIFDPWWSWAGLKNEPGLSLKASWPPLMHAADALTHVAAHPEDQPLVDEALQIWLEDPGTEEVRTIPSLMLKALQKALDQLGEEQPGVALKDLQWGMFHTRQVASLLEVKALGIPPYPADGGGGVTNSDSASWRQVVEIPRGGGGWAMGVYPGGQSEDPASPHYKDQFPLWRDGRYKPLLYLPAFLGEGQLAEGPDRAGIKGQGNPLMKSPFVDDGRARLLRAVRMVP